MPHELRRQASVISSRKEVMRLTHPIVTDRFGMALGAWSFLVVRWPEAHRLGP